MLNLPRKKPDAPARPPSPWQNLATVFPARNDHVWGRALNLRFKCFLCGLLLPAGAEPPHFSTAPGWEPPAESTYEPLAEDERDLVRDPTLKGKR